MFIPLSRMNYVYFFNNHQDDTGKTYNRIGIYASVKVPATPVTVAVGLGLSIKIYNILLFVSVVQRQS